MARAYASIILKAPVETVWSLVRDFNALPKWAPGIAKSKIEDGLESDVVGCVRSFHTTDGTLIKAWASHKSFKPKDEPPPSDPPGRNAESNWKGQARSNDTHGSTTDPQARLYKKSEQAESMLCYLGHVVIENRNGLVVNAKASLADGMAERDTALAMLGELAPAPNRTVGADKAYDTADFVAAARALGFTPHVAQNLKRRGGSAIDARTTGHPGYELSQCTRKRIEEPFGWGKTVGRIRQTVFRGLERVNLQLLLTMTANNLVRMRTLLAGAAS